jgi:hypothetical protein
MQILVTGLPRSGTSWVGKVLGSADDRMLLHEPDNDLRSLEAFFRKRPYGRFFDRAEDPGVREEFCSYFFDWVPRRPATYRASSRAAVLLRPLMQIAYGSPEAGPPAMRTGATCILLLAHAACRAFVLVDAGKPVPATVIVKSVHSVGLMSGAEWHGRARRVFVVRREEAIFASYLRGAMPDALRLAGLPVPRGASHAGAIREAILAHHGAIIDAILAGQARLRATAAQDSTCVLVQHEDAACNPYEEFRSVFARLGLAWTRDAETTIASSARPGEGYATRRTADQATGRWKTELTDEILGYFRDARSRG